MCFLWFHSWSKWSRPMIGYSHKYQWRICNVCGAVSYCKIENEVGCANSKINELLDKVEIGEEVEKIIEGS